ncbi:MAG: AMP-binding protein [Anaerolineales bacterium]|nr:AMP-binding protein [Anaerolineales bacterium]
MNSADILTKRALLTPNREAMIELASGVHYTYAELDQRANRAANFLREKYGVEKGDRVSILAHNSVAYVDLLFGLAKLGAILAPLNWRLTSRELIYIVNDCQPKVLIVGPEFVSVYDGDERLHQSGAAHFAGRGECLRGKHMKNWLTKPRRKNRSGPSSQAMMPFASCTHQEQQAGPKAQSSRTDRWFGIPSTPLCRGLNEKIFLRSSRPCFTRAGCSFSCAALSCWRQTFARTYFRPRRFVEIDR